MIGGILVDLLVVGAVLAFAWGATQLGGLSTLGRLAEAIVAFTVAALLRDPAGSVVEGLLGRSIDFSRLVGMIIVGLATWAAAHSVFRWWRGRRESARLDDADDEFGLDAEDDPLDTPVVARIAGGLLGLAWALLFVAMLVLQPADTPVSRSAIDSRVGGLLIDGEDTLRWLRDGFPHYTQTLPKGKLGALVGERRSLRMHEPVTAEARAGDADQLLRSINQLRRNSRVGVLAFNPDVASVARRHALSLVEEQSLSYRSPGGGTLDGRVLTALGETSGAFSEDVGTEVLWAHDPDTAMRGLLDSTRATSLLKESRWTEIGIGVADAGWFNGRIYVLLLVGGDEVVDDATTSEAAAPDLDGDGLPDAGGIDDGSAGAAGAAGTSNETSGTSSTDPFAPEECFDPDSTDSDGDGIPDSQPADPALADCAPDPALQ